MSPINWNNADVHPGSGSLKKYILTWMNTHKSFSNASTREMQVCHFFVSPSRQYLPEMKYRSCIQPCHIKEWQNEFHTSKPAYLAFILVLFPCELPDIETKLIWSSTNDVNVCITPKDITGANLVRIHCNISL